MKAKSDILYCMGHGEDFQVSEFHVRGMTCTNCALGLERGLHNSGWSGATVDFSSGILRVPAGSDKGSAAIISAVQSLGYEARPAAEGSAAPGILESIEHKFIFAALWTAPLMLHMFVLFPLLHDPWVQLALTTPVYLLGLSYFGKSGMRSLRNGFPNMDVLITLGTSAAFIYSLIGTLLRLGPDYLFYETSASIVTLVLLGNVIEKRSAKKTSAAIEELTHLQPNKAKIVSGKAPFEQIIEVAAADLEPGETLLLATGDKIPADGTISKGAISVDESMITGEALPAEKSVGAQLIGGSIVVHGNAQMVTTATGEKTVLSHIIRLVRDAQRNKPEIQKLGDAISAIFVPVVLGVAILTFTLSYLVVDIALGESLLRSIAVLVIACPCAMGLATPTAVMVGMGRGIKEGCIFRDGRSLELLSQVKKFAFDKTGTLTTGRFAISQFEVFGIEEHEAKAAIVGLEQHSSHPIAKSLRQQFEDIPPLAFAHVEETRGIGILGKSETGIRYALVAAHREELSDADNKYSLVLRKEEHMVAGITLKDEIRPDAAAMVHDLHGEGIQTLLVSGDKKEKVEEVAAALDIQEQHSQQLPAEKLALIAQAQQHGKVAYVGDGINDAPALEKADVGISLGGATHIAIESAGVILADDKISRVLTAVRLSRRVLRTIKQNLFWAFFYNVLAIPFAACGFLNPTIAAFTMALSDVVVIGNSLRLKWRTLRDAG